MNKMSQKALLFEEEIRIRSEKQRLIITHPISSHYSEHWYSGDQTTTFKNMDTTHILIPDQEKKGKTNYKKHFSCGYENCSGENVKFALSSVMIFNKKWLKNEKFKDDMLQKEIDKIIEKIDNDEIEKKRESAIGYIGFPIGFSIFLAIPFIPKAVISWFFELQGWLIGLIGFGILALWLVFAFWISSKINNAIFSKNNKDEIIIFDIHNPKSLMYKYYPNKYINLYSSAEEEFPEDYRHFAGFYEDVFGNSSQGRQANQKRVNIEF